MQPLGAGGQGEHPDQTIDDEVLKGRRIAVPLDGRARPRRAAAGCGVRGDLTLVGETTAPVAFDARGRSTTAPLTGTASPSRQSELGADALLGPVRGARRSRTRSRSSWSTQAADPARTGTAFRAIDADPAARAEAGAAGARRDLARVDRGALQALRGATSSKRNEILGRLDARPAPDQVCGIAQGRARRSRSAAIKNHEVYFEHLGGDGRRPGRARSAS